MTAAALLVVLGAALLMQVGGLSMAMGAFLAGVLLSESTFRHQIEADIEPFAASCWGCFLGVGRSLDLRVVAADWRLIVTGVPALMVGKGVCIYAVARLMRNDHRQALERGVLMAQGGAFAFVLFAAASASGVIDAQVNASVTAIVVLSMALHASGAHSARAIAVCVDNREAANRIVELATREFPHAKLLVRSYDREHSAQLVAAGITRSARPSSRRWSSARRHWWSWVWTRTKPSRLRARSDAAMRSVSNRKLRLATPVPVPWQG